MFSVKALTSLACHTRERYGRDGSGVISLECQLPLMPQQSCWASKCLHKGPPSDWVCCCSSGRHDGQSSIVQSAFSYWSLTCPLFFFLFPCNVFIFLSFDHTGKSLVRMKWVVPPGSFVCYGLSVGCAAVRWSWSSSSSAVDQPCLDPQSTCCQELGGLAQVFRHSPQLVGGWLILRP